MREPFGVLRALARVAGMHDPDDLDLADLSTVTLDEAGDVRGAAELLAALRRDKPNLFEGATTSSPSMPPAPNKM
jgi:hypothetical protein